MKPLLYWGFCRYNKKSPHTYRGYFCFDTSKTNSNYWQASHSASSFGSIGQVIGLSQSSSLIVLEVFAVSGIILTLLFWFFNTLISILPKRNRFVNSVLVTFFTATYSVVMFTGYTRSISLLYLVLRTITIQYCYHMQSVTKRWAFGPPVGLIFISVFRQLSQKQPNCGVLNT